MKITKKEKNMLILLCIAIVSIIYYQFMYLPQKAGVNQLKKKLSDLKNDYDNKTLAISALDSNKEAIENLGDSINEISNFIYPEIWQEKITTELIELKNKTGLKGSLSFSKPAILPIEVYFKAKEDEVNIGTIDELINNYDGNKSSSNKVEENNEEIDMSNNDDEDTEQQDIKEEKNNNGKSLVKQMKVTMNFNGTNSQLNSFIKEIAKYKRLVAIPDVNIASSGEGTTEVTGTLILEFYAIPKLGDEDLDYFNWSGSTIAGKENPFSDNYTSKASLGEQEEAALLISLRPALSDLPKIMIGQPDDNEKKSYIEGISNKKEIIEVEFTKENGKYLVNYNIGNDRYPATGSVEFNTSGKLIKIDVTSASRLKNNDNVAAQIVVKNKTDKKVVISIKDDDKENPRVNITAEGDVQYTNN